MPDPNNVTLTGKGLTFMLIPKVANTSIKVAMLQSVGVEAQWPGLNHFMAQARTNAHIFHTADKYRLKNNDSFKIAFVRNPYGRIVSCYRDKVVAMQHKAFERHNIPHGCSLDHFLSVIRDVPDSEADQHFRSQYHELYCDGELVPNFVGRFENLAEDWKIVQSLVSDRCGLTLPDLPHANKGKGQRVELSDAHRAIIAERYANDFAAFGYEA